MHSSHLKFDKDIGDQIKNGFFFMNSGHVIFLTAC